VPFTDFCILIWRELICHQLCCSHIVGLFVYNFGVL